MNKFESTIGHISISGCIFWDGNSYVNFFDNDSEEGFSIYGNDKIELLLSYLAGEESAAPFMMMPAKVFSGKNSKIKTPSFITVRYDEDSQLTTDKTIKLSEVLPANRLYGVQFLNDCFDVDVEAGLAIAELLKYHSRPKSTFKMGDRLTVDVCHDINTDNRYIYFGGIEGSPNVVYKIEGSNNGINAITESIQCNCNERVSCSTSILKNGEIEFDDTTMIGLSNHIVHAFSLELYNQDKKVAHKGQYPVANKNSLEWHLGAFVKYHNLFTLPLDDNGCKTLFVHGHKTLNSFTVGMYDADENAVIYIAKQSSFVDMIDIINALSHGKTEKAKTAKSDGLVTIEMGNAKMTVSVGEDRGYCEHFSMSDDLEYRLHELLTYVQSTFGKNKVAR